MFWFLVPETLVHCAQEAVIGPAVFIMVDQKQKRIPKPQPSSISFNPIWAPDFIDGASHISSWSFLAQFILSEKTPTDTEKVICVFHSNQIDNSDLPLHYSDQPDIQESVMDGYIQ